MLPLRRTKATTASFSTVRGVVYEASTTPSMVRCFRVAKVASNWLLVLRHRSEDRYRREETILQQRACISKLRDKSNTISMMIRRQIC